jgi:lipopolysaccharide/colanic/teichoic acid biosynthesis glycosyltransferase
MKIVCDFRDATRRAGLLLLTAAAPGVLCAPVLSAQCPDGEDIDALGFAVVPGSAAPPASAWAMSLSRRLMDIAISLLILMVFAAPMLLLAACVRLTSEGDAIFRQERVGRGGRLFKLYKFRSMAHTENEKNGPGLTKDGDYRVTPVGRFMRKFKLDELPQFLNILRGEMSLVGPRPKLPQYAALLNMPYRPGITGAATLAFHREEEMLRNVEAGEMDRFYAQTIKPVKTRLDACYMCHATFASDMRIVAATVFGCLIPQFDPALLRLPSSLLHAEPLMGSTMPPEDSSVAD